LLLDYENVTVYRGDRVALDAVTFAVGPGEHVAILGPNGSGKSTLIKTMTRECYPYRGRGPVRLRIMDRETWSVFDLRAMLGIVTNDLVQSFTRHMTGRAVGVLLERRPLAAPGRDNGHGAESGRGPRPSGGPAPRRSSSR
jgi:iron complex transport system ATP-binding protein